MTTFSLNGRTVSVDSPSDAPVAVGYQSQPGTSGGVKAALGRLRQLPGGFFVSPKKTGAVGNRVILGEGLLRQTRL